MQVATTAVTGWFILALISWAIIFLLVYYWVRYRPWKRRLWEDHEDIPPHTRGEGVPPNPFPGDQHEYPDDWWIR